MKKVIAASLSFIIFLSVFTPLAYANDNQTNGVYNNSEFFEYYEARTRGLTMSPTEFNNAFGGEPNSRFMPFNLVETELTMHNIEIDGSNITMDLVLSPVSLFGRVTEVQYSAFVTRLNGNQNDLTITVVEYFENGQTNEIGKTFRIDNNSSGIFTVGNYEIFVNTQGNTRISEIRLIGDGRTVLPIDGTIFNGNRDGAVVIKVENDVKGYEILLFEVNTTPETHNLLLPSSYTKGLYMFPHTKVYLVNDFGDLFLFEVISPEIFAKLNYNNFSDLEDNHDILWSIDFVIGETIEFEYYEVTDELLKHFGVYEENEDYPRFVSFGLAQFTTTSYSGGGFSHVYTVGNERFVHSSFPQIRRRHNNIARNGNSNFDVMFRVREGLEIQNVHTGIPIRTHRGLGVWEYRGVEVVMQLGNHTHINHFTTTGRMRRNNTVVGVGTSITATFIRGAFLPSTANAVLSDIVNISNRPSAPFTLGANWFYRPTSRMTRSGREFTTNYRFFHHSDDSNGHYLHVAANAQNYIAVANQNNVTQHGGMRVSFFVYRNSSRQGVRRSIQSTFTYTIDRRP